MSKIYIVCEIMDAYVKGMKAYTSEKDATDRFISVIKEYYGEYDKEISQEDLLNYEEELEVSIQDKYCELSDELGYTVEIFEVELN